MLSRCCQWPISQNFFGIIYTTIGVLPKDFTGAYTARGINYDEKSFIKLTPMAIFIKLFGVTNATIGRFYLGYTSKGIKYAEENFIKFTPGACATT
jgi:hypothetical protein